MIIKQFALIFTLLFSILLNAQTTFFIKYKNNISINEVQERIVQKKILSSNTLQKTSSAFSIKSLNKSIVDENISRIVQVSFDSESEAEKVYNELQNNPEIEYIQRNSIYKIDSSPNDSLYNKQWALNKINAELAWNITQGDSSVLLAIIDTGIDYFHPDLRNKIKYNYGEIGKDLFGNDKQSNGIDDDNNGFTDDYMGWDFTDRKGFPFDSTGGDYLNWDNNPFDDYGHGTLVAGIAGAESNNSIGISGVAPNIKLLNVRAFDPEGYGEEDDAAAAILYAINLGAKVINMSFGDKGFSLVMRDVIRYAYSQGVILVASSGNDGSNQPHYPSGYNEVISVGNSTFDDFIAGTSNYGSTIDLVAPGSSILTTSKGGNYQEVSGTSASAPFVSAAASLLLSIKNFTNDEVAQILKSSTDDLQTSGWDERSGSGRLNLLKTLQLAAPSIVKFNYPKQDFAVVNDSLNINISVLSAYFKQFSLQLGVGYNPTSFTELTSSIFQTNNSTVHTLITPSLLDTVYTLRLLVEQTNGISIEERINIHVIRDSPKATIITAGSAYYGNKTVLMGAMASDQDVVCRLYYKPITETEYRFITLDGFAINNQFVRKLHYGFVPAHLLQSNIEYDVYFEVENLAGYKTIINNEGFPFTYSTSFESRFSTNKELDYSLPIGTLYKDPVNFTTNTNSEILFSTFYPSSDLYYGLYRFENNSFVKIDSIRNQIPKDVTDLDNDGLKEILTSIQRNGNLLEQEGSNSSKFNSIFADSSGTFWPIFAEDLDQDGQEEVLAITNDSSFAIYKYISGALTKINTLKNFSSFKYGSNNLNFPNAVIDDLDKNGKKEIWMVDEFGDVFSYEHIDGNNYKENIVFETGFSSSGAYLTSGDYNGDGFNELAVLLKSIEYVDLLPFYRMLIFSFQNQRLNIFFDKAFINPANEFKNSFRKLENSIRFFNIDGDKESELILNVFPYSYIFDASQNNSIIFYKENVNTGSIFAGDLNKNGIPEIAFSDNNGYKFYEFLNTSQYFANINNVYSLDSNSVYLDWQSEFPGQLVYIYRGLSKDNLQLVDSAITNFIDVNVQANTTYFYAVKVRKEDPFITIKEVYSHQPGIISEIEIKNSNTLVIKFNIKVNKSIDNLRSFYINELVYPNSINLYDEYSYLLTFNSDFKVDTNILMIAGLRDIYNSEIKPIALRFIGKPDIFTQTFYIKAHALLSPYSVRIEFNSPVNSNISIENFLLTDNLVKNIKNISEDKLAVIIETVNPVGSIGKETILRIINLTSVDNILIEEGAGSYIVITGFKENLSEVYVYPNPTKSNTNEITFANLPKKCKINIFTISGEQVAILDENDGNGGINYNLLDLNGKKIKSGIYIYRVVQLDQMNNEQSEVTGKFAVIN